MVVVLPGIGLPKSSVVLPVDATVKVRVIRVASLGLSIAELEEMWCAHHEAAKLHGLPIPESNRCTMDGDS
jgi:hypothetical protein